jgi:hypothetical protein
MEKNYDKKQQKSYCPPPPHEFPLSKIILITLLAFSLILSLSLSACKDGGGNGGNGGGGITGGVIAQGIQVKDATNKTNPIGNAADLPDYTGSLDFTSVITNYVPGSSVKITNGKLYMTLGTPKSEYLSSSSEYGEYVTPSNTNFFEYANEGSGGQFVTGMYVLGCVKRLTNTIEEYAGLMYVDRDVTVKVSQNLPNYELDCSLKKGWNYMVGIEDSGNDIEKWTSSQMLPSDYYWVVFKN